MSWEEKIRAEIMNLLIFSTVDQKKDYIIDIIKRELIQFGEDILKEDGKTIWQSIHDEMKERGIE